MIGNLVYLDHISCGALFSILHERAFHIISARVLVEHHKAEAS